MAKAKHTVVPIDAPLLDDTNAREHRQEQVQRKIPEPPPPPENLTMRSGLIRASPVLGVYRFKCGNDRCGRKGKVQRRGHGGMWAWFFGQGCHVPRPQRIRYCPLCGWAPSPWLWRPTGQRGYQPRGAPIDPATLQPPTGDMSISPPPT